MISRWVELTCARDPAAEHLQPLEVTQRLPNQINHIHWWLLSLSCFSSGCLLWLKAVKPAPTTGGQCRPSSSLQLLSLLAAVTDTITHKFHTCKTQSVTFIAVRWRCGAGLSTLGHRAAPATHSCWRRKLRPLAACPLVCGTAGSVSRLSGPSRSRNSRQPRQEPGTGPGPWPGPGESSEWSHDRVPGHWWSLPL